MLSRSPQTIHCRPAVQRLQRTLIGGLALCVSSMCLAESASICGELTNNYGPFDYRDWKDIPFDNLGANTKNNLQLVVGAHFVPECEALVKCKRGSIASDIEYTLRAFPNHHRALVAFQRYGEKMNSPKPADAKRSVDCYYERALRFRPDDTIARLLYVNYLLKNQREPEAKQHFAQAQQSAPTDNPFTQYNLGRVAFELKDYETAQRQAEIAQKLGLEQPALEQQLRSIGKWREPDASAPAAGQASQAASAVQ